MSSRLHDLKTHGLKVTQPRLKILQIFEQTVQRHLSAEEVYQLLLAAGEEIGIATVYRVLGQFEASGILMRLNFDGDQSVYELNDGEHHDHLICVICHKVEEFYDEVIEQRQCDLVAARGDKIVEHSHYIYVECKDCQDKRK